MHRSGAVRVAALLAVLLAALLLQGARVARADESCPGCYGKGRVGCGRCLSSGMGAFIGKCHTCCGFFAQTFRSGERCPTCRGSQVCVGCNGKGAACMVCKGSGRVPDGFARAVAEDRARKQAEGLEKNLKKRLRFLVGRWTGEGEDAEQGKYSTEMRFTSVLDDAFLRYEERTRYENGGTQEYVGFLTWVESDQSYLWNLLFAPGKGLKIRGVPGADGGTIVWEIVLDTGAVLKVTWGLNPGEKRLDSATSIVSHEGTKTTGTCRSERSSAEPGAPIVTATSGKRSDEATDALLEAMKPLRFLIGKWTGTGENDKGRFTSQGQWTSLLGGTVHEADSTTTYGDGSTSRTIAALWLDPNGRKIILLLLGATGTFTVFKGDLEGGEDGLRVTIDLNGARLVWSVPEGGRKIDWFVDVPGDAGRTVVEKGIDTKE